MFARAPIAVTRPNGPPFQYRVTRYDPIRRDPAGRYLEDDWTSFADVGRSFAGRVLSEAEYRRVEDGYVAAASAFLEDGAVDSLAIEDLRPGTCAPPSHLRDGARVAVEAVGPLLRLLLRERFSCRLEAPGAFLHVGRALYMYVGLSRPCRRAIDIAHQHALFVEPFPGVAREDLRSLPRAPFPFGNI